jgi:hypothetical protein
MPERKRGNCLQRWKRVVSFSPLQWPKVMKAPLEELVPSCLAPEPEKKGSARCAAWGEWALGWPVGSTVLLEPPNDFPSNAAAQQQLPWVGSIIKSQVCVLWPTH